LRRPGGAASRHLSGCIDRGKGKRVTGFANSEEEAVQLTHVVPFLVEDELKRLGGLFEKAPD
jgi:hypothetical protein